MNDSRIEYVPNSRPMGAIGNIDKSFISKPLRGGRYAFVLEDDNYLLTSHIENAIEVLERNEAKVMLCNQLCERVVVPGEPGQVTGGRTLDWMYEEGLFDANSLLPVLMFSHGFSNGAAFWRTDCLSNFQLGGATSHPGIQESLRLLRIRDPIYVSLKPTSVWRSNDSRESYVNRRSTIHSVRKFIAKMLDSMLEKREKLDYRCAVLKSVNINDIVEYIKRRNKYAAEVERSLLLCGHNVKLTPRRRIERFQLLLIGRAVRLLIPRQLDHGVICVPKRVKRSVTSIGERNNMETGIRRSE
jgi:hypothetical protein